MFARSLERQLKAALADTPAVMLVGARQTGKSTLASELVDGDPSTYLSFDDPTLLAGARAEPTSFVDGLERSIVIDEVQRAPEIFLPLKASIDRDRRPGRFLLTGSANPLFVPEVADALAGRMEVLTLWPFSQAELEADPDDLLVDRLFEPHAPNDSPPSLSREQLVDRIVRGGFPEAVERDDEERRGRWFSNYLSTILERDVRSIADIARLEQLPRVLTAIALRSRGPSNKSALSQDLGIPVSSFDRYLTLLERVFLLRRLPGWHTRLGPRLVKSPKLLLCDPGLLCHLLRWDRQRLIEEPASFGLALESFVGAELMKAADVASSGVSLMHYRTSKGVEIDFVVETADGRVTAIEVKASSTVEAADFRRFDHLREALGPRFVRGLVIYTGDRPVPFGDRLEAWPVSRMWGEA
jgi:predicted AAA+ superfamily ATPase